ncbi:hypothetical protein LZC95_32665 [Pendulispora brunnea]|uniref:Uncharacterized protein n=1 Tax=Pendulispora brunnea TaxID=2905690 RepID=A0ABZ2JXX2_9BACT
MNTIHGKLMALALVALAGTTIDSMALASEESAPSEQSDQNDEGAEASDQDDEGMAVQAVRATCPRTVNLCRSGTVSFPGGTMSIDADVNGGGTGSWIIFHNGGPTNCRANFPAVDPPRSWVCQLPKGTYSLGVYAGQSGQWAQGAIRW